MTHAKFHIYLVGASHLSLNITMIPFNQFMESVERYCDNCSQPTPEDDLRGAIDGDGKPFSICRNCIGNDDWAICTHCESFFMPSENAEQCIACAKKDSRYEVRYDEGLMPRRKYLSSRSAADNFAKANSYKGNAWIWYKGKHLKGYWQGK